MRMGNRLSELKDFAAAQEHLQAGIKLRQALIQRFPKDLALSFNLALNYASLANMYQLKQQAGAAMESWELAHNICDLLASSEPDNRDWKITAIAYGGKVAGVDGGNLDTAQRLVLLRASVSQLQALDREQPLPPWGKDLLQELEEKVRMLAAVPPG
jgi:hypothetical protein